MNDLLNRNELLLNAVTNSTDFVPVKDKRLVEYAAENPSYVISEVFKGKDSLKRLQRDSHDWLHVAMCTDLIVYENGDRRTGLMIFFNELRRLIEGLYLLKIKKFNLSKDFDDSPIPELDGVALFYIEYYEMPASIISEFCTKFSIEHCRRELWDWMHAGISYGYTYPEDLNEVQILYTYEDIECLTEAAYGFYRQVQVPPNPDKPKMKSLDDIIVLIVEACQPDRIFKLYENWSNNNDQIKRAYFLVLLPGSSSSPFHEYEKKILEQCADNIDIVLLFKNSTEAYRFLEQGNIFYTVIYNFKKQVYYKDSGLLPDLPEIISEQILKQAIDKFQPKYKMAQAFLNGAKYYLTIDQKESAAFILHQAVEHSLRALLYSLMGHNNYDHDLPKLLKQASLCAPELINVLPQNTDEHKNLLSLLNNAYVGTRYRNNYVITDEEIKQLIVLVEQLQIEIHKSFNESIVVFKSLTQII